MCGIVGFLDKTGNTQAPVGRTLLDMLSALARRGPDSSGVALYGDHGSDHYVVRIKLGEQGPFDTIAARVIEQVNSVGSVLDSRIQGSVAASGRRISRASKTARANNSSRWRSHGRRSCGCPDRSCQHGHTARNRQTGRLSSQS